MQKVTEDPNHPNANGSRIMTVILITAAILLHVLLAFFNPGVYQHSGFWIGDVTLIIAFSIMAVINLKNKFETNDPWKTWSFVIAFGLMFIWVMAWLSDKFNG